MRRRPALDAKMEDAGVFVFHGGVLPPESATVVCQSGREFLITDGPYTETKEHLGGFWIIDVADLDAALEWARLVTVASRRCRPRTRSCSWILAGARPVTSGIRR